MAKGFDVAFEKTFELPVSLSWLTRKLVAMGEFLVAKNAGRFRRNTLFYAIKFLPEISIEDGFTAFTWYYTTGLYDYNAGPGTAPCIQWCVGEVEGGIEIDAYCFDWTFDSYFYQLIDAVNQIITRSENPQSDDQAGAPDTAVETQYEDQAGEPLPDKPPLWGQGWTADDYFDWMYRRRELGFRVLVKEVDDWAGGMDGYHKHSDYKAQYGARPKPDDESRFKSS